MKIEGIGELTKDDALDWFVSEPTPVRMFDGHKCVFYVEGDYAADPRKVAYERAIHNFVSLGPEVFLTVQDHVFAYYKDVVSQAGEDDECKFDVDEPPDAWDYVAVGDEIHVHRRDEDGAIYLSVECNCDLEVEHGLQIVFKDGLRVNKIGGYDGHLTNSDAYDSPKFEDVVYVRIDDLEE